MVQEIDSRNFKEKAQMKWNELVCKAQKTKEWMVQHPTETVAIITLGVGVIAEGRRTFDRVKGIYDARMSRLTCYCNDVQGYVRLKHELNYKENRMLRDLMNQGYTKFEALDRMNLLR